VEDKYVKGRRGVYDRRDDGKNGDDEIWRSSEYSGWRSRVEGDRRNVVVSYRGEG
jgi:hypothetical protein